MFNILKKENISLVYLQISFWSLMCITYTFLSSYLYQEGISISIVAFIFSISKFIGIFTQISLITFINQSHNEKRFISKGIILMTMTLIGIYVLDNILVKLIGIIILGIFENSLPTLMDSWLIHLTKKVTLYTRIKSFASLSFSASSLLVGVFIGEVGFKIIPIISLILLALNIFLVKKVTKDSVLNSGNFNNEKHYKNLTKFHSWMIIAFGIGFIILPFNQILPLLIFRVNSDYSWLGILISIMTISQFIIMLLNHKFLFKQIDIQITFSFILYILGLFISIQKGIYFIVISQILLGIGLGMFIPAFKGIVINESNNLNIRRNLFFSDLIIFSIAPFIVSFILGVALPRFDLNHIIYAFIIILIITLLTYFFINAVLRRREENEKTYNGIT